MATAQLPGQPETLTPEEKKERDKLIIALSTAVATAIAEKWVADRIGNVLASLGFTKNFMSNALRKFYIGIAGVSYLLMREMPKVEINDSSIIPPNMDFVNSAAALEMRYEMSYARKGAERIIDNMRYIVENEIIRAEKEGRDPTKLDDASKARMRDSIHGFVSREQDYSHMRISAMKQRIERKSQERDVQAISPDGAFWMLNPSVRNHTVDCLAMGGKTWSWEVLAIIRPSNRHYGCRCELIPQDVAVAAGFAGAEVVHRTVPSAAREAPGRHA